MPRDLSEAFGWLERLERKVSRIFSGAFLESASISNGRLRFIGGTLRVDSGGRVEIVGALVVNGQTNITGPVRITGRLDVDGPWAINGDGSITGRMQVTGPWGLQGDGSITGRVNITGDTTISGRTTIGGDVTLDSDLTLGSGRFVVGALTIERFSASGRIRSTGIVYLEGQGIRLTGSTTFENHVYIAGDLDVAGAKNFRMPHPLKPNYWLRHGSTESPVSGTEYTGRATLDENGEATITLPDYFEALNKPEGRTIQLTPVGRPFAVGADDIEDGTFTAYGEPGREVCWLVKAERYGGDFLLEEPQADTPTPHPDPTAEV